MNVTPTPFACTHSAAVPGLLHQLGCTIAISTYQAGKVVLLSSDGHKLIQLLRSFQKPMGLAVAREKLAVATEHEVLVYNNAPRMAHNYPAQPGTYDALYLPRATYFTGEVDIHDLHWQQDELWAVNTRFSCLAVINHQFSFIPKWKPFFIKKITPEDQCHLNGVAFLNDLPAFVTALGRSDAPRGWQLHKATGGILMHVESNTIVAEHLKMPHSPRVYQNQFYLLESATGELSIIDTRNGKSEGVLKLNGFVRGMDFSGDYAFIGLSRMRKTSASFTDLPVSKEAVLCGVVIVHLPSLRIEGTISYLNSIDEIYDVRILPFTKRPGLLSHQKLEHKLALTTPEDDYWAIIPEPGDDKS
jgi:uncharacterized protein (TIGR03032 family)